MQTTAAAPAATDAIDIATFRVRETSVRELVDAMTATGAKLAKKVPGLAVHVATGEASDNNWCARHRAWAGKNTEVCSHLSGATQTERELSADCWIAPARQVELTITATGVPTWGDWDVYAVLTTSTTGVTTATVLTDRDEMLADEHVALAGQCAHCGRKRARTSTVLLRNVVTGEIRPVGKSCLADYTGSAIRFEALAALTAMAERFQVSFGVAVAKLPAEAPTVDVVALAMRYIAARGKFISRSNCNWSKGEEPTSHEVVKALTWTEENVNKAPEIVAADLTAADRKSARQAIAAVLADQANSPYAFNLRAAASAEWTQVDGKGSTVGLLASLPTSAERAREFAARQAEREAARQAELGRKVNEWVGTEGQRREFTGTIRSASVHEGDYGMYEVVTIETAEGALKIMGKVTWPGAAAQLSSDELVGRAITLTGTITRHDEFRGERQTRINRVKIASVS